MQGSRARGMLLAAFAVLLQALITKLTASLEFNLIALAALTPWTLLLLIQPFPSATAGWVASGATALLVLAVVAVALVGGGDDGTLPITYTSKPEDGDPLTFEMTDAQLTVSGVSSDVWGDTVLIACMTRAGAFTYEDGRWVIENVGNVATAEAEWPSGDQALTVFFTAPLTAPPALCAMEGSDGDIGSGVFCNTGDETEIPGAKGGPDGLEVGPDGKIAYLVDEACAEETSF